MCLDHPLYCSLLFAQLNGSSVASEEHGMNLRLVQFPTYGGLVESGPMVGTQVTEIVSVVGELTA